jgi:hypothetical protein
MLVLPVAVDSEPWLVLDAPLVPIDVTLVPDAEPPAPVFAVTPPLPHAIAMNPPPSMKTRSR